MVRDDLNVLSAFVAVADERSFTRAARQLGVSASALSHAIRGLERIGVRLLLRGLRQAEVAARPAQPPLHQHPDGIGPSRRQQPAALSALIKTLRI